MKTKQATTAAIMREIVDGLVCDIPEVCPYVGQRHRRGSFVAHKYQIFPNLAQFGICGRDTRSQPDDSRFLIGSKTFWYRRYLLNDISNPDFDPAKIRTLILLIVDTMKIEEDWIFVFGPPTGGNGPVVALETMASDIDSLRAYQELVPHDPPKRLATQSENAPRRSVEVNIK